MPLDRAKIRHLREARKLTLREAGERAGWGEFGKTRWHRIESGDIDNPTLDTLSDVARVLGVRVGDIVEDAD